MIDAGWATRAQVEVTDEDLALVDFVELGDLEQLLKRVPGVQIAEHHTFSGPRFSVRRVPQPITALR